MKIYCKNNNPKYQQLMQYNGLITYKTLILVKEYQVEKLYEYTVAKALADCKKIENIDLDGNEIPY